MVNLHAERLSTPSVVSSAGRSKASHAFEAHWRALPGTGLLPTREQFRPADATSYLPYIVLLDIDLERPRFGIRLVGTGFEQRIQCRIDGLDHLTFLDPEYRAGAVETARLMLDHPCGCWQRMCLHYARGISEPAEVTAFPFAPRPSGEKMLICYVRPLYQPVMPEPTGGRAMRVDTAIEYAFLDLGAGVPEWSRV